MKKYSWLIFYLFAAACSKDKFLSAPPDQSQVVPSSLEDLQAILDNDLVMNGSGNYGVVPSLGETGADNYYVSANNFNTVLKPLEQNAYTWAKNIFSNEQVLDWNFPYRSVFYANEVLDVLPSLTAENSQDPVAANIKGSALFYRAHMFYQLAQVFAPPYDSATAAADLGIPLRLHADVNETMSRATLQQTYARIIDDLQQALPLLPVTPLYKTRPSKPAVYGLLARLYQTMQNYSLALQYADSCLQLQKALLDYNTLDSAALFPFPLFNDEVIFHCTLQTTDFVPFVGTIGTIDTTLYRSYDEGDLRKTFFYKNLYGQLAFTGSYNGTFAPFGGIAADEIYFIKAECEARQGNVTQAMSDLNTLLKTFWKTGTYKDIEASGAEDALQKVLQERRKQLVFRALRWTDLRRLNKDSRFAITLTRVVSGQVYTLPPNDPRYVYPIPPKVIAFNPSMPQNER
jgi:hypothetical protein